MKKTKDIKNMEAMNIYFSSRQRLFHESDCDEILYGGAAGGGKSFALLADALIYAMRYPCSKQLILRRTFPELERSLIRSSQELYPMKICDYNARFHLYRFKNGSMIEFGSCEYERDVIKYQSAEYDVIRFDELTHFTEYQYLYLMSRLRGPNSYPKQMKAATNPGGVGHSWVRRRFIDPAAPESVIKTSRGTRIFIPARVTDNIFLMKNDPDYIKRLQALPEREKRALLEGDWNIVEGRYFDEFNFETHTCPPFELPASWRRWRAIDYGLDRLVCLWVAADNERIPNLYVYRELCQSNVIISDAAQLIITSTADGEEIVKTAAPPDLWSRSQESGRCKAVLFADSGLRLTKCGNDRETGWLLLKELFKLQESGLPRMRIFRGCRELIGCLPQLMINPSYPSDVMTEPHSLTHAPDALRYFASLYMSRGTGNIPEDSPFNGNSIYGNRIGSSYDTNTSALWTEDMWEDYINADEKQKSLIEQRWGHI